MKEYFSNRFFRVLTIIELAVILYFAAGCFTKLTSFELLWEEMETVNGIESEEGIYTDETVGEAGYFVYGPSFDIDRGVYNITVRYASEGNTNYIVLSAGNAGFRGILMDDFILSPDLSEQTFTTWVQKDAEDFAVSVIYDGNGKLTIKGITIEETRAGRLHNLILVLFWVTLMNLVCRFILMVQDNMVNRNKLPYAVALAGIIIFASYPLFTTFLTEGDDLIFHLLRIEGIAQGLLAGQFPVRIQPVQYRGYGYACSVFYGELLLYIPALLRLCGFTLQNAYKIFIILVNIATALIAYQSMKVIVKDKKIAMLCCMVYVLSPYRLANIYVRSAVGEYSAMMFWPMIAAALYRLYTADDKDSREFKNVWVWLVIGYSGLIQTHLLSCELAAVASVVVCLIMWRKTFTKRILTELLKFFSVTILLNVFYLIPFLSFMIRGGVYITEYGASHAGTMQGNGLYPAHLFQLFVSGSGMAYGHGESTYSVLGMSGEMGTTVGLALILGGLVFLYLWISYYRQIKQQNLFRLTMGMTLAGFFSLYMATMYFPWDFLTKYLGSLVDNLQFPWRILSLGTLFFTIALGGTLVLGNNLLEKNFYYMIIGIISLFTVVTASYMLYDRLNTSKAVYVYDGSSLAQKGTGSADEYLLAETTPVQLNVFEPMASENIRLTEYEKHYTNIYMTVQECENLDGQIYVPLLGYPGYKAVDRDGNKFSLTKAENGMLSVMIPAGYEGSIEVSFAGFWYWRAAEIISLAFFLVFLYYVIKSKKKVTDI